MLAHKAANSCVRLMPHDGKDVLTDGALSSQDAVDHARSFSISYVQCQCKAGLPSARMVCGKRESCREGFAVGNSVSLKRVTGSLDAPLPILLI